MNGTCGLVPNDFGRSPETIRMSHSNTKILLFDLRVSAFLSITDGIPYSNPPLNLVVAFRRPDDDVNSLSPFGATIDLTRSLFALKSALESVFNKRPFDLNSVYMARFGGYSITQTNAFPVLSI
jgi:hypothetical protein